MLKEPEAKQWWVGNKNGEVVYVCGFDSAGDPMIEHEDSECEAFAMDTFIAHWHHEPDCTGFDWVKPEPVPVESPDDLVIQDRVPARVGIDRCWWSPADVKSFPSFYYWTFMEHHKHIKGMKDGDCDDVGYTLNLCCRRADLPPLESDDDWVTQDVVVPRINTDEWAWVTEGQIPRESQWERGNGNFKHKKHGDKSCGEILHVRCRRKDLPKPPEPAKTRVELRLWVCESGVIKHSKEDPSVPMYSHYNEVLFDTTGQPYYLKD